jgi:hypothetical protein
MAEEIDQSFEFVRFLVGLELEQLELRLVMPVLELEILPVRFAVPLAEVLQLKQIHLSSSLLQRSRRRGESSKFTPRAAQPPKVANAERKQKIELHISSLFLFRKCSKKLIMCDNFGHDGGTIGASRARCCAVGVTQWSSTSLSGQLCCLA